MLFVNGYDLVPRLPSCSDWVFDAVPKVIDQNGKALGPLKIGIDVHRQLKEAFGEFGKAAADYNSIGTLMFICSGSRAAMQLTSTDDFHFDTLKMLPSPVGSFIFEQHSMPEYLKILNVASCDCDS